MHISGFWSAVWCHCWPSRRPTECRWRWTQALPRMVIRGATGRAVGSTMGHVGASQVSTMPGPAMKPDGMPSVSRRGWAMRLTQARMNLMTAMPTELVDARRLIQGVVPVMRCRVGTAWDRVRRVSVFAVTRRWPRGDGASCLMPRGFGSVRSRRRSCRDQPLATVGDPLGVMIDGARRAVRSGSVTRTPSGTNRTRGLGSITVSGPDISGATARRSTTEAGLGAPAGGGTPYPELVLAMGPGSV
jgi:hypothetical protein